MTKDISYHESVLKYNEEMAVFALELSKRIEHPEPKKWCVGISKQHDYHARSHRRSLQKLLDEDVTPSHTSGVEVTVLGAKDDYRSSQKHFAEAQEEISSIEVDGN